MGICDFQENENWKVISRNIVHTHIYYTLYIFITTKSFAKSTFLERGDEISYKLYKCVTLFLQTSALKNRRFWGILYKTKKFRVYWITSGIRNFTLYNSPLHPKILKSQILPPIILPQPLTYSQNTDIVKSSRNLPTLPALVIIGNLLKLNLCNIFVKWTNFWVVLLYFRLKIHTTTVTEYKHVLFNTSQFINKHLFRVSQIFEKGISLKTFICMNSKFVRNH